MTWVDYKNINQVITENGAGCQFCRENRKEFVIKKGTFIDPDLIFLTYITFIQNDDNVIEIGAYPFNGADIFYCKACDSIYYRYFNEGHIGGMPEYQLINSNWHFETGKACCSITFSKAEINMLSDQFDIVNFKPHKFPVTHTYSINSSSLPPLISINQREIENNSLIRYDLAGNRKLLHDLSRLEYDKLIERSVEYQRYLQEIEVATRGSSGKIPGLISEIRVCSQKSL